MLLVVSESLGKARTLIEVARELSLSPSYFTSPAALAKLMSGELRRIVVLAEDDLSEAAIEALAQADQRTQFGLIVGADREALRSSNRAELLDRAAELSNVVFIPGDFDTDTLCAAARECRRGMLRISKRELEAAIIERQFVIQYQPKVERTSGSEWITKEAEALIRWRHPEHGMLGPLEFLPEVEAFDLMATVSELVLNEVAGQLVKWREQGFSLNSCINLSTSLLTDSRIPERYVSIVNKHGLECASFTFEVAEKDIADTDAPHLRVLNALREKGFRISLDDFGAAASSLSAFEQLPFDEIKIHASLLARARSNNVTMQVLAAVTGLAHNLGISVCAEGVEDEETFEFLKTIECDKMQGFLISEAVMPDIIRRVYTAKSADVVDVVDVA
jgi:EAL domain-containing protein (putative c-di-GMP-specific phosphodiesterase class I)